MATPEGRIIETAPQPPIDTEMKHLETSTLEKMVRGCQLIVSLSLKYAKEAKTADEAKDYLLNAKSMLNDHETNRLALALSIRRFPGPINLSPLGALAEQTGNYYSLLASLTPQYEKRSYFYFKAASAFRDWVNFEIIGTDQRQNAEDNLNLTRKLLEKSQKPNLLHRILPARVNFPYTLDTENLRELDL